MAAEMLIIENGRVIDPVAGMDGVFTVLCEEGKVKEIAEPSRKFLTSRYDGARRIDARGMWVVPGLIDMHVHLREPGEEYKETVATGCLAAAAGGFTAVAAMPNTKPVNDNRSITEFILARAAQACGVRVFPVGAISVGQKGEALAEMGDMSDAGAVAFSDDGKPVVSSELMRRAIEYAGSFGRVIISHAEDLTLSSRGVMNEGAVSTRTGLAGIPSQAEEIAIFRDIALAELAGGRVHIAHVSTAGGVRLVRDAKARGLKVTAETAPHYFTLTDEAVAGFDTNTKMNPPLRSAEDREEIRRGLRSGLIDAIASDHAPHNTIEKEVEFDYARNGIIGLETSLPLAMELVEAGILTPQQLVERMSAAPARILDVEGGTIAPGRPADITVLDPETRYRIDSGEFRSKSRNTPFHGREVKGRARCVVVGGRIVFSAES